MHDWDYLLRPIKKDKKTVESSCISIGISQSSDEKSETLIPYSAIYILKETL